jgi:phosphoribosylformylglycinamidine synthase
MGAAGLTSSAYEMADRSGSGMIMHLDRVPAREEGMVPYEFMLSESQERMLICAKKGHEEQVLAIFRKYELEAEVIGEVTDTGRMQLMWHGETAADMPISPVVDEAPILDRPTSRPAYLDEIADVTMADFDTPNPSDALIEMIAHPEVADKRWIYEQYDSTIQTNSVTKVGMSDAGVIRVKDSKKAIAMSCDCNPRYCFIDPKMGAAQAVVESGRNVAMSGARPKAITDCLNFGNPENPEVMWQFAQACAGIKEACLELTTPVVSGNVSLYNETNGTSVFPTPAIAMVGIHDDNQNILTAEFKEAGNSVYLLGQTNYDFGGSLYMKVFGKTVAGKMAEVDYETELKLWDLIISANSDNLLKTAHDVSVGGVAVALAKMTILGNLGFEGSLALDDEADLFSETQSRALVEVTLENEKAFEKLANELGVEFEKIGTVTKKDLMINSISLSSETLNSTYFSSFETMMKQDI